MKYKLVEQDMTIHYLSLRIVRLRQNLTSDIVYRSGCTRKIRNTYISLSFGNRYHVLSNKGIRRSFRKALIKILQWSVMFNHLAIYNNFPRIIRDE